MDNLNESENNAKISDSAYSNSCSNSQSRRSHSSTHSGSHSSRSSGYGGKQSVSSSNQPAKKWSKGKDGKKKKPAQNDLVQIQAGVEFRLPKPAMACEVKEEVSDVTTSPSLDQVENGVEDDCKNADIKPCDDMVISNTLQSSMKMVMSKPSLGGFSCVISMDDGIVIYSTASLAATLGFPKDMWIGRSFIDFIHPLDHSTFASQITSGLATSNKVNLNNVQSSVNSLSTMFCRIRRYRGLVNGFSVKDGTITFMPFMLKLSFRNINDGHGVVIYLVIEATALFSAFKAAHEIVTDPVPFVMRHVSNGILEYIDHESVPLLGYLPQDVIGKDILRLYHPDDLVYMRQVYETILKEGGAPRSKSYRLMAQNGHYLKLETEWSSFINPWSRKLDFVIGKHHIVEGPEEPDVFQPPVEEKITTEAKNKAQGLRDSIVRIMNEVLTKPAEFVKQQMTKRCQDLASLMETLMEEPSKIEEELRLEIPENENSYFERDSVMLGGISPHHDYNDSKSSTTTPLSYNQLNFNDNLQRYFNSHEQVSYEEYEDVGESVTHKEQNTFSGSCMSPMAQQSGDSAEMTSSGESTGAAVGDTSNKPPRLTESLLNKHNSEMEKSLVMQHRECRSSNKESREKASIDKQKKKGHLARCNASYLPTLEATTTVVNPQPHGLKRTSTPLESETATSKQFCAEPRVPHRRTIPAAATPQTLSNAASVATTQWQQTSSNVINPYMSNMGISQQLSIMSTVTAVPGLIPMYCVPTTGPALPSTSEMITETHTSPQFPVPHMQYMMYGQAMFGSPFVVSQINPHLAYPIQPHDPSSSYSYSQDSLGLTTSNYEEACKPGLALTKPGNQLGINFWLEKKRAKESQATSSKVDQGSGNSSSIGSTSNALNRRIEAVPESSNSRDSKTKGNRNSEEAVDRTDEESTYSSFYSSFFKTESGSAEDGVDAKKGKNGSNPAAKGKCVDSSRDKVMRSRQPPWMEHVRNTTFNPKHQEHLKVCVTPELVFKYQVSTKSINEVLSADKQKMISLQQFQPSLVNEQLGQLYTDMELEGVAARLTLEEGSNSSGSSGDENALTTDDVAPKRSKRKREYSELVMIYEEDAPIPPPCETGTEIESTDPATEIA